MSDDETTEIVESIFKKYPKIPRRKNLLMTITEKIDGTNAQINIAPDPSAPLVVGSRNKIIIPASVSGNKNSDNYGFAQWVMDNEPMLRRLGPGRHYGEWWGPGVGKRYTLTEKRLSLFSVDRYSDGLPEGCPVSLVPVLYRGPYDMDAVYKCLADLIEKGSVANPGWMKPEGVVVNVGDIRWKEILDKDGPSPEE